jgi:hypothetical protein
MHHCAESIFKVDFLREYESIFETALAHESVGPGVLFDEKNQRSKISCYCPFKRLGGLGRTHFITPDLNKLPE